jgi:hypothetical protein
MKTKDLKLVLEKFLTSDAATNARVQVCLPNGEFYDISGMQLMENKLFGVRETVKSLASSISKLYEGKNIKELAARGLQLDACCLGLDACRLHLEQLGLLLAACLIACLLLDACGL